MKLTIFQSNMGDCVMLTSASGAHVLVDGGMTGSYREHVAPKLGALRKRGDELAVVCVSHIDNDHIAGVLRMLDDEVDWRVHEYQRETGNTKHKAPKAPRPPVIRNLWHNAFHEQIKDNADEIVDALAASGTVLTAAEDERLQFLGHEYRNLATGVPEAIRVSQRIRDDQLGIPLNAPAAGKLMMVRATKKPIRVGGMRVFVLAPFEEDLAKLREEWNTWLRTHREELAALRRRARDDADSIGAALGASAVDRFIGGLAADARDLGRREGVTAPNLASLMLLVEEGGKRVLLTGDGHADEIIRGLEHYGRLPAGKGLHVDVFKLPHHGAEFNTTEELARRVTADHYVFCANGAHENPNLHVIDLYLDARLSRDPAVRSANPQAGGKFTMWFNSSSRLDDGSGKKRLAYFRKVEAHVRRRARASRGKLTAVFMADSSRELAI